ncbi:MAG: MBL fold metallo-hydrolase [Phycisphaerales bacterium JB040]
MFTHARHQAFPIPNDAVAGLCVLASGSAGNCSVLVAPASDDPGTRRRVTLIDCGLSPRKTARLLAGLSIDPYEVDDIVLTHLDTDHCHPGWAGALSTRAWNARLRLHRMHRGRAERAGLLTNPTELFEGPFSLGPRLNAEPTLMSHDDLGVASFRFRIERESAPEPADLGFATDLGRATDDLIEHLHGVDTLAIESNYCPRLQECSDRPAFLKHRITGGSGHLSNQEALRAVERIQPRDHVVFLHLSRECNRPELVSALHAGGDYSFTISQQHRPTRWVWLRKGHGAPRPAPAPVVRGVQPSLFHAR